MRGSGWPRRLVLFVAVIAVPALLAGCSMIPGWSTQTPGTAAEATTPPGDSWLVVTGGTPQPSTSTRTGVAQPTPTAGSGFLPLPSPSPTGTAGPDCTQFQRQGQINGLTAVAGPGSATVSWYNPANANLVKYRLAAMPQHLIGGAQKPLVWREFTPGEICGIMTATITGLDAGMPYIMSLDAVVIRMVGDGDVGSTVSRSGVVYPK
jgi:hypothetical protein